jgi:hypothetical protein
MNFNYRNSYGSKAEQEFKQWVHMQPGWEIEQYGQGLMNKHSRQMMRETPFNGDSSVLVELIASMTPQERNIYMDRIKIVPNLTRWMPDFVLARKGQIVCAPDIKTSISTTPNWAVEMSSIMGSKLHSKTGVQCIYAFPPTQFVDYWSCASPDQLRSKAYKILDGKAVKGGSGTPFYLIPKRVIDLPLKQVMTEIELNGSCEIVSNYGKVTI